MFTFCRANLDKFRSVWLGSILFSPFLFGCSIDTGAVEVPSKENITQIRQGENIQATDIVALNSMACLLSTKGKVYCWHKKQGQIELSDLIPVDVGGESILRIRGQSGDTHYFDTGHHACGLSGTNTVHCWGNITEETVFDADTIFNSKAKKSSHKLITSTTLTEKTMNNMGTIKDVLVAHSTICAIGKNNSLFCPHKHLDFLNNTPDVKNAVFGEILSCIQNLEDEVECYDMRSASDNKPIFINLNGESWPKEFNARNIYASGIVFITHQGDALYWEGSLPSWDAFPAIYGLPSEKLPLKDKLRADKSYMSESTVCVLLNNGSAKCWGRSIDGKKSLLLSQAEVIEFSGRKILDIALGESQNCFLLSNHHIQCIVVEE